METLKINYILVDTGRTGGTRVVLNFANELAKMGHEVTLTSTYYNGWFPLRDDVKINTKNTKLYLAYLYGTQKFKSLDTFMATVRYIKQLYEMQPLTDINVATTAITAYVASWRSFDHIVPFYHMQHFESLNAKEGIMKEFITDSYFLPTYRIANSSWLSNKIGNLTGKIPPVLNGAIEHEIFYKRNDTNKFNTNKDRINITALGKAGWKNAVGIFQAVTRIRRKYPKKQIILHYFGHKPVEEIPFNGKDVIFHKDLSDEELGKLYSDSDIQVTFSSAESFPLPPLEAMASGCSVITTPIGTEDYARNFENSLIVEPDNIEMLADKIELLIRDEDLRNKLSENAVKTASKFSYKSQTKLLESNLKLALDNYGTLNKEREIL